MTVFFLLPDWVREQRLEMKIPDNADADRCGR